MNNFFQKQIEAIIKISAMCQLKISLFKTNDIAQYLNGNF